MVLIHVRIDKTWSLIHGKSVFLLHIGRAAVVAVVPTVRIGRGGFCWRPHLPGT